MCPLGNKSLVATISSPIFLTFCHGKTGASISTVSSSIILRCSIIITALVPFGITCPVLSQNAFSPIFRETGASSHAPKLDFASRAIPSMAAAWKFGEDKTAMAGSARTLPTASAAAISSLSMEG